MANPADFSTGSLAQAPLLAQQEMGGKTIRKLVFALWLKKQYNQEYSYQQAISGIDVHTLHLSCSYSAISNYVEYCTLKPMSQRPADNLYTSFAVVYH